MFRSVQASPMGYLAHASTVHARQVIAWRHVHPSPDSIVQEPSFLKRRAISRKYPFYASSEFNITQLSLHSVGQWGFSSLPVYSIPYQPRSNLVFPFAAFGAKGGDNEQHQSVCRQEFDYVPHPLKIDRSWGGWRGELGEGRSELGLVDRSGSLVLGGFPLLKSRPE